MGKNVLVLCASPRKGGNSDALAGEFSRGAKQAGNKIESIYLRDKNINYCIACDSCGSSGGACFQSDDMVKILDKMIAADVIVMATPVYFYTMSAQMKTLIDRTYPRYTEISGKEFYFILTAGDDRKQAMERTVESFRGFTSCLDGAIEKGVVYGTGALNKGDIAGSDAMIEAYKMGKSV